MWRVADYSTDVLGGEGNRTEGDERAFGEVSRARPPGSLGCHRDRDLPGKDEGMYKRIDEACIGGARASFHAPSSFIPALSFTQTGDLPSKLEGHTGEVQQIVPLSLSSKPALASMAADMSVRIWNTKARASLPCVFHLLLSLHASA